MKRNKIWKIIPIFIFTVCLWGALSACGDGAEEKTVLPSPENFRVEDATLYWDEVEGATKYLIYFEDKGYYTDEPCFDMFDLLSTKMSYSVEVSALGDDVTTAESDPAEYTFELNSYYYMFREDGKGGVEIKADEENPMKGLLVIPDAIEGKPVTKVVDKAFMNCTELTGIILPDTVTEIGTAAFKGCTSLERVILPARLAKISSEMFRDCTSLRESDIPNDVTSVERFAFVNCTSLKSLTIPKSMTDISSGAWSGNRLGSIEMEENDVFYSEGNCIIKKADKEVVLGCAASAIPEGVTSIGMDAFSKTGIEGIAIPESVNKIGDYAFENNPIKNFVLPAGVTALSECAFLNCNIETLSVDERNRAFYGKENCILARETNIVVLGCSNSVIPAEAQGIGPYAFTYCDGLTEISIPSNVKSIGDYAFATCKNLKHVYLANGLEKIGEYSFQYCWSLDGLAIPESVTEISYSFGSMYTALYMACDPNSIPSGWVSHTVGINAYFYNCVLAYDEEGYCYVVRTGELKNDLEQRYWSYSCGMNAQVPCRRGYTFAGWATEEGGEVVFGTEVISGVATELYTNHRQEYEYTVAVFSKVSSQDSFQQTTGKTLHAVWVAKG